MSTYPFFVNSTKLACVSQCYSTETQFPANSICIACTSPCLSCYSVQNNCTTCIDGYEISSDNSCIFKTEITEGSKLYLLGLLGLIPILIICTENNIIVSAILHHKEAKVYNHAERYDGSTFNQHHVTDLLPLWSYFTF